MTFSPSPYLTPFRYQLYQPKEKGFYSGKQWKKTRGSDCRRQIQKLKLWEIKKKNWEGGDCMTLKLGMTILLVVFIVGSVLWLNLRRKKK